MPCRFIHTGSKCHKNNKQTAQNEMKVIYASVMALYQYVDC